jgi:hypothetical protein
MHHFPQVPWDGWPDMPYELVLSCIAYIDSGREG